MLFCHAAVMADVRKVKIMKIKASLPKIRSFPRCLTSYFSIIKVFIVHPRDKISSPISLNRELGQLNILTNSNQSIHNGIFSPEKPRKPLLHMQWKALKIKGSSHFKVSMFKMERVLGWKVFYLRWKGPWGNSSPIFLSRVLRASRQKICCSSYMGDALWQWLQSLFTCKRD